MVLKFSFFYGDMFFPLFDFASCIILRFADKEDRPELVDNKLLT